MAVFVLSKAPTCHKSSINRNRLFHRSDDYWLVLTSPVIPRPGVAPDPSPVIMQSCVNMRHWVWTLTVQLRCGAVTGHLAQAWSSRSSHQQTVAQATSLQHHITEC